MKNITCFAGQVLFERYKDGGGKKTEIRLFVHLQRCQICRREEQTFRLINEAEPKPPYKPPEFNPGAEERRLLGHLFFSQTSFSFDGTPIMVC